MKRVTIRLKRRVFFRVNLPKHLPSNVPAIGASCGENTSDSSIGTVSDGIMTEPDCDGVRFLGFFPLIVTLRFFLASDSKYSSILSSYKY